MKQTNNVNLVHIHIQWTLFYIISFIKEFCTKKKKQKTKSKAATVLSCFGYCVWLLCMAYTLQEIFFVFMFCWKCSFVVYIIIRMCYNILHHLHYRIRHLHVKILYRLCRSYIYSECGHRVYIQVNWSVLPHYTISILINSILFFIFVPDLYFSLSLSRFVSSTFLFAVWPLWLFPRPRMIPDNYQFECYEIFIRMRTCIISSGTYIIYVYLKSKSQVKRVRFSNIKEYFNERMYMKEQQQRIKSAWNSNLNQFCNHYVRHKWNKTTEWKHNKALTNHISRKPYRSCVRNRISCIENETTDETVRIVFFSLGISLIKDSNLWVNRLN